MIASRFIAATVLAAAVLAGCQKRTSNSARADSVAISPVAPDSFRVEFETGKGRFVVLAVRAWAPLGVDRFHELVQSQYYDGVKFFRVLPNFMAQFGISGDPERNQDWSSRIIPDDPVKESNKRGMLTFATAGPNTRSTQLFINTKDNAGLDAMGFSPIGRVIEGIDVVEKLYNGYGEGAPQGNGPDQTRAEQEGNRYLNRQFPLLDSIIVARVVRN